MSAHVREHRVFGPPGTGKTHYLGEQAGRAAHKYGAGGVAIVSLTKAAAEEIGSRVTGIPDGNVGTLHAFAYRALGRPPLAEDGEGIKQWNAGHDPLLRLNATASGSVDDLTPEFAPGGTEGEKLLEELNTRRARMESPDLWPVSLRRFAKQWQEFKDDTGRLDFTDLIERLVLADPRDDEADPFLGEDHAGTAGRCPGDPAVLMVDEAQDCSRLEFTLLRRWADHAQQLVVVGDPDQNLYEWRGSEPDAMTGGQAASEHVLSRSRRVPRAVRDYALDWVQRIPDRKPVEYEPRLEDPDDPDSPEAAGEVCRFAATWSHPEPLLAMLDADAHAGRSSMVLTSCQYMLDPLLRELRRAGIPFHNPYRPKNGAWNPMRGARRLLAFLRADPAVWGDEHRYWTWDDVRAWTEPLKAQGVLARGAKTFIESKCTEDRFGQSMADAPAAIDVLFGRGDDPGLFATVDARDRAFAMDVDWWGDSLLASKAGQMRYPLSVLERRGADALRARPLTTVGTIHSVKGGEADVVYAFPDLSRQAFWLGWQIPNTRAPIIRQFYVAFTRARHRLVVLDPAGGEYAQLPQPTHTLNGGPA